MHSPFLHPVLAQTVLGFTDTTWALVLLGAGIILYIVEVLNPGFFLAIPGSVLLVAGFLMIVDPSLFDHPLAWLLILVVSVASTWATIQIYRRMAPPEKSTTTIGIHNVVGLVGRAETEITPIRGEASIQGESWRAQARQASIPKGARVVVVGTEGALTVIVEEVKPPE